MARPLIYSCDDHLDMNAVPLTLWTDRIAAEHHEVVPHVVEKGPLKLWIVAGTPVSVSGRYEGIETAIDRAGVEDDGFRASTPSLRMQDMERDGIWASVVYGPTALFRHPLEDPALIETCVRAWNDWAADEFNAHAPDRLFALPDLPTTSAGVQMDEILSILVFSGVLERHPDLRVVLAESGVGWVPYLVARMDATFEKHCAPHPEYSIRTRPSELFARQVWATFEEEPLGPELIPLLSPDNFMWACDYPHPDSTWPHSREAIDHALGKLGPEAVEKITGGNCKALYGLP